MAIKAVNGDLCVLCNVYNKYWCLVEFQKKILVFGAKNSSCCGFLQKKPQQAVLRAKTSRQWRG
jgi:hypothetical protein